MLFQSFKTVARQIFRPLMQFFDRRRGRRGSKTEKPITPDEAIDLARNDAPMARVEKRRKTRAEVRREKAKAGKGDEAAKKLKQPRAGTPRTPKPPVDLKR